MGLNDAFATGGTTGHDDIADVVQPLDIHGMSPPISRRIFKAVAVASFMVGLVTVGFQLGRVSTTVHSRYPVPSSPFDDVLDGDTIIDQGRAIHIRDLDSPELGPWASCWAEAALAGFARTQLETTLTEDRGWRLVDMRRSANGLLSGKIIDKEGFSIADYMSVHGASAMTSGKWNWCSSDPSMRSPSDSKAPPHGPSLWWPSGAKYDPRAAD